MKSTSNYRVKEMLGDAEDWCVVSEGSSEHSVHLEPVEMTLARPEPSLPEVADIPAADEDKPTERFPAAEEKQMPAVMAASSPVSRDSVRKRQVPGFFEGQAGQRPPAQATVTSDSESDDDVCMPFIDCFTRPPGCWNG